MVSLAADGRSSMGRTERFSFYAFGHSRILSTHDATIEITRCENLTIRGNCVVGVRASHGLKDFPNEVKRLLGLDSGRGRLEMRVNDRTVIIEGRGAAGLAFQDPREVVVRKSGFVSERTLMVYADKAASDIPPPIVKQLKYPGQKISFELSAWSE
jgi:uncharacterized protein